MNTRATIEKYFERLKAGSGWEECLAEDMVFTSLTSPAKTLAGRAPYLQATKRFYGSIASAAVRELIVDGDRAAALTRYTIAAPNGVQTFQSDVAEFFIVCDGRIAEFTICFDTVPYPK